MGDGPLATLHEAMAVVLRGRGWMSLEDVADEIASQGLWLRPSDGRPPQAAQLRRRVAQSHGLYQDRFELGEGGRVRYTVLESGAANMETDGHAGKASRLAKRHAQGRHRNNVQGCPSCEKQLAERFGTGIKPRERLARAHDNGWHADRTADGCPKCKAPLVGSIVSSGFESSRRSH